MANVSSKGHAAGVKRTVRVDPSFNKNDPDGGREYQSARNYKTQMDLNIKNALKGMPRTASEAYTQSVLKTFYKR